MTSATPASRFDAASLWPGLSDLPLPEGVPADTRVCLLDITRAAKWRDKAIALLVPEEHARHSRFLRQVDADRYALARAALRTMLAAWRGVAPAAIRLKIGICGKPELADRAAPHFNLSHAGEHALIGLASRHAVGIDIETVEPNRPIHELAAMLFSTAEREHFGLPCNSETFHQVWTAREAVFKAWGSGIRDDIARWSTLPLAGSAEMKLDGPGEMPGPTRLWRLPTPAGYAATLALLDLPG